MAGFHLEKSLWGQTINKHAQVVVQIMYNDVVCIKVLEACKKLYTRSHPYNVLYTFPNTQLLPIDSGTPTLHYSTHVTGIHVHCYSISKPEPLQSHKGIYCGIMN